MTLEILCISIFIMLFGLASTFSGYRLFRFLLPLWGFFAGFGLGAQTLQALFGVGFLSTITSFVAGFVVGSAFSVLSYLFFNAAVALASYTLGYGITIGIWQSLGYDYGFLVWLLGIIVGILLAYLVMRYRIHKYIIIFYTAFSGAGLIILALIAPFGGLTPDSLSANLVQSVIQDSFLWLVFFLIVALLGIGSQIAASRNFIVEDYNLLVN